MKLLTELKLELNYKEEDVFRAIFKKYNLLRAEIINYDIVRESLDARKKPDVFIKLNVAVDVINKASYKVKNCQDIKVNHNGVNYDKLLIVDEAHNFVNKIDDELSNKYLYKLGLSATPVFGNDTQKTQLLIDWFGGKVMDFPSILFG